MKRVAITTLCVIAFWTAMFLLSVYPKIFVPIALISVSWALAYWIVGAWE